MGEICEKKTVGGSGIFRCSVLVVLVLFSEVVPLRVVVQLGMETGNSDRFFFMGSRDICHHQSTGLGVPLSTSLRPCSR